MRYDKAGFLAGQNHRKRGIDLADTVETSF